MNPLQEWSVDTSFQIWDGTDFMALANKLIISVINETVVLIRLNDGYGGDN